MNALALKAGFCLNGFLWAFVSLMNRWGWLVTFWCLVVGVAFGAAVAKDLGRLGSNDWREEE